MKYLISGARVQAVTLEIEADDIDEAMELALDGQFSDRDVDSWDTDYQWQHAMAVYDPVFP